VYQFNPLYTDPSSIMPPKEKYTDPKLRDEVKEEIHNGDKGGAPGQWSARKAQMMAAEYVPSSSTTHLSISQILTIVDQIQEARRRLQHRQVRAR
jgi:gamma-glutamyltranspeptidase